MRILVIYNAGLIERNTTKDYLCSFKQYDLNNEYYYLPVRSPKDLKWIKPGMFDALVFDCTFLGYRTTEKWTQFCDALSAIRYSSTYKIILPQDEYTFTSGLWDFINKVGVDIVFSVMRKKDFGIIYPSSKISENVKIRAALTGYVDDKYIGKRWKKTIDVMYRARALPYEYGRLGQYKKKLADLFIDKIDNLTTDIKNTSNRNNENVLRNNEWFDVLGSARVTLGCLSGSSIMDEYGRIARIYQNYMHVHPNSTYAEAKKDCFPSNEENLHGVIGPRIFEAALTRTCQVLVGYDYQGILEPNVDYIVLEEDFSNIDSVIERIRDKEYCERIADNCYKHVVESKKYSYKNFVESIISEIPVMEINYQHYDKQIRLAIKKHKTIARVFQLKCKVMSYCSRIYHCILDAL